MEAKNEEKKRTTIILIILAVLFMLILLININKRNVKEEQELITGVPTIVDLGSDCYTCNRQKEYLDTLKEKYTDKINITKIDIYDNPSEAEKYKIKVIPTLIFLDEDGKQIERHEGLLNDSELEQKLIDLDLISMSCSTNGEGC